MSIPLPVIYVDPRSYNHNHPNLQPSSSMSYPYPPPGCPSFPVHDSSQSGPPPSQGNRASCNLPPGYPSQSGHYPSRDGTYPPPYPTFTAPNHGVNPALPPMVQYVSSSSPDAEPPLIQFFSVQQEVRFFRS